jgi:hypothetical protein
MKLLGRDIPTGALVARIEERLRVRGLPTSEPAEVPEDGVEPRVDPLSFNMHALEENADTTRALPLHTHRAGMGQAVLLAKWAFRKTCQVLINETLGRQRVFNGLVRDSYAQLSAEVLRLRKEVDTLRAQAARAQQAEGPRPPKPPPAIEHGRPKPHASEEGPRPPKPPPAIEHGRPKPHASEESPRPPKPPPAIEYGRPKPHALEEGPRPPKPGGHHRPPEHGPHAKTPDDRTPPRERPLPDIAYGRPPAPAGSSAPPKPPPGAGRARPAKPPRAKQSPSQATPGASKPASGGPRGRPAKGASTQARKPVTGPAPDAAGAITPQQPSTPPSKSSRSRGGPSKRRGPKKN